MGIILQPFAWLLLKFYELFNSYGLALILFAIVIKLILFPVTLKSKKSMIQTSLLSGKMQQLQKQYGKDRERYNLEVQKLYEREKVNPMGGCLWSMIPLILLIGLFYIIREPLTYFMGLSADQIQVLARELDWQTVAVARGWVSESAMNDLIADVAAGKLTYVFQDGAYNQLYLLSLVNQENLVSLQAAINAVTAGAGDGLFILNFDFLNGIDLSLIPNLMFWENGLNWPSIGLFLLPIISVAASLLSMKVSMATNRMNNNQPRNEQMERTNKMMMWTMPIMSLWIGFTVPAGLSVYWIAQYLVNMIQEVICGRILKKDYEAARAAAAERERQEKEDEKKRREEARLERARRIEEEKQNRGKKKHAPKKKDVEPDHEGVNKDDSREGIRAYARGRSYIPNRFGGVTPYTDPDALIRAQVEAARAGRRQGKKDQKKAGEEPEQKAVTTAAPEITPGEQPSVQPAQEMTAPAAPETTQPVPEESATQVETEEVEIEVEQIEEELPETEDDKKEGV